MCPGCAFASTAAKAVASSQHTQEVTARCKHLYESLHKNKKLRRRFEFLFVSADRDEHAFRQVLGSMPWKAIPFQNVNGAPIRPCAIRYTPCAVPSSSCTQT